MNLKKENIYLFILVLIAILPNIISYFLFSAEEWFFLTMLSLLMILLPALFFKKKVWLWNVFIFVLFSPFEIATLLTTQTRINNVIIASILLTSPKEAVEFLSPIIPTLLLSVGLIFLYIFLLLKIRTNTYLQKKYRIGIAMFAILIVS